MKPSLIPVVNKKGEISRYELVIGIADGRSAICQLFPLDGELRYRYLVREADSKTEKEYFSSQTHPQILEMWNQLPEGDRPERPARFNEVDLQIYLKKLSEYRGALLAAVWVPIPGVDPKKAPTPEGVFVYDPTKPHGGKSKAPSEWTPSYADDADDADDDD